MGKWLAQVQILMSWKMDWFTIGSPISSLRSEIGMLREGCGGEGVVRKELGEIDGAW